MTKSEQLHCICGHSSTLIQRLFTLSVSFGFHGPPLLTFKTDRLDLGGLDLGKSEVI